MPIVGKCGNIKVEYFIPYDIINMIDKQFLEQFRNELLRIFKDWSIDSFEDDGIPMNTNTIGWNAAFSNTCIVLHKESIYSYYRGLTWYDADAFDGIIADMMVEQKVILDFMEKYIEKYLGIKVDSIKGCCDCKKYYLPEEVILLPDCESKELFSRYRCKHCQEKKDKKILNTKEYNDDIFSKLKPFIKDILINELGINKEVIVECKNCHKLFLKNIGIETKEGFLCHYCNDHNHSEEKLLNLTDYYRHCLKEEREHHWENNIE